ncbi:hypothetical protein [Nocardioides lijunqiniae]|uniref:hypothetical protein n=1 Tax=Nocardioides lijunqiniae TaxID=2760832 RepID=UPI0018779B59|nr:hypothetical protein [Nocardioides lijunqiniae]
MLTNDRVLDPRLTAWVEVVDYYWQRATVPRADRDRLRAALERDLASSVAEGATVEELVAVDPADFASEVADADGIEPRELLLPDPPLTDAGLLGTVVVGAAVGAALSLATVYPIGVDLMDQTSATYAQQGLVALGLHSLAAAVCLAAALSAVWWRYRFRSQARRVVLLTGVLLVAGGLLSIAPAMLLASATGYSSAAAVVLAEIGIVVGLCSAGVLAARRLVSGSQPPREGGLPAR